MEGASASFSIAASGTAPLQYQWRRNGTNIAAASSSTLTLATVALNENGDSFSVVVTNSAGSVTSAAAVLTVTAQPPPPPTAPTITVQPQPQLVSVGGSAVFSVTAAGTEPLEYQWRRDGVDIPGAMAGNLILTSLTLADDGASISVVVANAAGSIESTAALLTVIQPPVAPLITQDPQSIAVPIGGDATFSVTATGIPTPQYQWRRNGADIAGATSATLTVPSVTLFMTGQVFTVVVSNVEGTVTSAAAVLTVNPPPVHATVLSLATNDLIYDRFRNLIYASVPANDSVAIIDPTTGTVQTSIPVGDNPGVLAISDDSHYLYVGLEEDPTVERVDLVTRSVDLSIALTPLLPQLSPAFALDIAVAPGSPRTIAVSQRYDPAFTPPFAGIAVFDDATRRGPLSSSMSGPIEFGASAARLYGYDDQTSAYSLHLMTLGAGGLSTQLSLSNLIMGIDVDVKYEAGFMFSSSGSIIDPEFRTLFGSFPVDGIASAVRPDLTRQRVYFLANPAGEWQVQSFDTATFTPTGFLETSDNAATAGSLIRCGFDGLAFLTSNGQVHIIAIGSLQLPPPPADPGPGVMSLATNDLVHDATRGVIYASIPGKVPTHGNSIAAIDPVTETVLRYVFVGSEPNKLAMSDDSQYLYVALDGAPLIQRIALDMFENDATIVLSPNGRGIYVADMQVLPGSTDSIAVSRRNCCFSPSQLGVAVYDSGTPRANVGFSDSVLIAFGASAARLYGYDTASTLHGFQRMTVTAAGVTLDDDMSGLLTGDASDASELKYDGGLLFVNALAIDPEARVVARTFAATGAPRSVVPETPGNRVFILTTPAASTWRIESFNMTSAAAQGTVTITDGAASAGSLVRWGADGLAFRTASDRIYLRRIGDLQ
jgi:hypothetical protein